MPRTPRARGLAGLTIALGLLALVPKARSEKPASFHVQLRAEAPGTSFHLHTLEEPQSWRRMCEAPCALDLQAGPGVIGVAVRAGEVLTTPIDVRSDLTLVAQYQSRQRWRNAGIVALGITLVAATVVVLRSDDSTFIGHYGRGFAVGIGGTLVALPLLAQRDRVTLVEDRN